MNSTFFSFFFVRGKNPARGAYGTQFVCDKTRIAAAL
jgi:hypothetical protein